MIGSMLNRAQEASRYGNLTRFGMSSLALMATEYVVHAVLGLMSIRPKRSR